MVKAEIKKHECPVCGSTEWKVRPKIVIREGRTHVVGEMFVCAKCGYAEERGKPFERGGEANG